MRKYIISGGGTGGHIFPALSIANEIKRRDPEAQILFVGAKGRMEEEKVPAAGYEILTLPVRGLERRRLCKNIPIIGQLLKSMATVYKQLKSFRPDIVIGVGGYASAPTLMVAHLLGIPTLVQEQNSYAGVTNKIVGRRARRVCVAYRGMERFFPADRITLTGNPVRQSLLDLPPHDSKAYDFFGLDPRRKTILVVGGSLGARTINESISGALASLAQRDDLQLLWQTGKHYAATAQREIAQYKNAGVTHLVTADFIYQMDKAFSVADLVISRAGAGSISEFCLLAKPVLLVPSPNVSEDHQTKNAQTLVQESAAVMVRDADARQLLVPTALELIGDEARLAALATQISRLALPHSAQLIVDEVDKIIQRD